MSESLPQLTRTISGPPRLFFGVWNCSVPNARDMQVYLNMQDGLTTAGTYMTTKQAREVAAALIEVADFYDAAAADMQQPLSPAPAALEARSPLTDAVGAVLCDETGPAHPMPVSQHDGD
jgi:hypothetical protein